MHDKCNMLCIVWIFIFLGICIVNCKIVSQTHFRTNLIDSLRSQGNVTQIEIDGLLRNTSYDENKMKNEHLETYSEASMLAVSESRSSREREKKKKENMFTRLLPMFIVPYLIQSAILPMMLMSLKAMLLKSLFVGKLAIILVIYNMIRTSTNQQQQYKEIENDDSSGGGFGPYRKDEMTNKDTSNTIMAQHYGYNGNEEYGAWIHHRSYKN